MSVSELVMLLGHMVDHAAGNDTGPDGMALGEIAMTTTGHPVVAGMFGRAISAIACRHPRQFVMAVQETSLRESRNHGAHSHDDR